MKKIIFANLKMNQTVDETKRYFTKLLCKLNNDSIQLVVCPPFTSLSVASFFTEGSEVKLGAQNLSEEEFGALTGEISAKMLRSSGVEYVIVGHPDRRIKFRESNSIINKKIKNALKQGLRCVLCVGENLAEHNTLKTADVIRKQLEEGLKGLYENELESLVVVYEPFWAVGSSATVNVRDIENGARIIRRVVNDNYSEKAARDLVVVYGGGLNSVNYSKLLSAKGIDGAMFGSACFDGDAFANILNKLK